MTANRTRSGRLVLAAALMAWPLSLVAQAGDAGLQTDAVRTPAAARSVASRPANDEADHPSAADASTGSPSTRPSPRIAPPETATVAPAPSGTKSAYPLAPGQAIPGDALQAMVDGVVREQMAERHLVGVTVSVVQNGQILLNRGYGAASLSPYRQVDPERTLFRLGPVSQTFTWIMALKAVEEGHMRLDAPVNLYLPASLRLPEDGFAAPVLVRDLMDQSAGLETRGLGQAVERDPGRVRSLADYLRDERPRRTRPPGAELADTPYGAALAGAALAAIGHRPFEDLAEAEILRPLSLTHTTFREPREARAGLPAPAAPDLAGDMADGYRWSRRGARLRPFEYLGQVAPAEGASSTAGDMARLMMALLGGGATNDARIYGERAAALFAAPLPAPTLGGPVWRGGLQETVLPGGFTGVARTGSTLSFHSALTLVPRLGLGVFISTNSAGGAALTASLASGIVGTFYAPPPGPPPPGSQILIDDRPVFAGAYRSNRRAFHGLEGFVDRLFSVARVTVEDDGRLTIVHGRRHHRFTPQAGLPEGRFLADDGVGVATFAVDNGRAVRFVAPGGIETFERIDWFDQNRTLAIGTLAAALASVWTVLGALGRRDRDFRQSSSQGRAGVFQTTQALVWLAAFTLFAVWAQCAADPAALMYQWPGMLLIVASSCALVASVMSVPGLILLPLVWRGGRRVDSWTALRKLRYSLTALIFLAYGLLLALWGALEPWSA